MIIQYGRTGTEGRVQEKEFSNFKEAKKQAAKSTSVLWAFKSNSPAFGIFISKNTV